MIYTSGTTGKPKGVRRDAAERPTPPPISPRRATASTVFATGRALRFMPGPLYHSRTQLLRACFRPGSVSELHRHHAALRRTRASSGADRGAIPHHQRRSWCRPCSVRLLQVCPMPSARASIVSSLEQFVIHRCRTLRTARRQACASSTGGGRCCPRVLWRDRARLHDGVRLRPRRSPVPVPSAACFEGVDAQGARRATASSSPARRARRDSMAAWRPLPGLHVQQSCAADRAKPASATGSSPAATSVTSTDDGYLFLCDRQAARW